MSKLERARDKLTALKEASTPGPWEVSRYQGDQEINAPMEDGQWTAVVDFYKKDSTDPELIVALHATLDAQLDILNRNIDQRAKYREIGADLKQLAKRTGAPVTPRPAWKTLAKNRDAYVLADAILKETPA